MATLSVCMIVKNEENNLGNCLSCLNGIADEIIIVDTGSTDATKEIAARFTDKIYDFEWIDDFSAARNFAFSKATMDYSMWLDADDIITEFEQKKLAEFKKTLDPSVDGVMLKYNTGFDAQGNVTFSYYRERIVRTAGGHQWQEPVHEYIKTGGKVITVDIAITHNKKERGTPGRNIAIYEKLISQGKELSPRGMYYYARELRDNGRYKEAAEMFGRFLDGGKGWVEDNICACGDMARCLANCGDPDGALRAMLRSFAYDTPRAEICCQIGYHFKNRGEWKRAAFWFELALGLEKPKNSWGFIQHDLWGYVPCLELAICYDKLGDPRKARSFNNKAAKYKPDSKAVLHNREYFKKLLSGSESVGGGSKGKKRKPR